MRSVASGPNFPLPCGGPPAARGGGGPRIVGRTPPPSTAPPPRFPPGGSLGARTLRPSIRKTVGLSLPSSSVVEILAEGVGFDRSWLGGPRHRPSGLVAT